MGTLEATVSMLQSKNAEPKIMTEEQMLDKLDVSRNHASEGKMMDADIAISKLRTKYGL